MKNFLGSTILVSQKAGCVNRFIQRLRCFPKNQMEKHKVEKMRK